MQISIQKLRKKNFHILIFLGLWNSLFLATVERVRLSDCLLHEGSDLSLGEDQDSMSVNSV